MDRISTALLKRVLSRHAMFGMFDVPEAIPVLDVANLPGRIHSTPSTNPSDNGDQTIAASGTQWMKARSTKLCHKPSSTYKRL